MISRTFICLSFTLAFPFTTQAAEDKDLAARQAAAQKAEQVRLEKQAADLKARQASLDARAADPAIRADPRMLTVFSAYRDPVSDAADCAARGNCGGAEKANCSAHRSGMALATLGRRPEAIGVLSRALELQPSNRRVAFDLARLRGERDARPVRVEALGQHEVLARGLLEGLPSPRAQPRGANARRQPVAVDQLRLASAAMRRLLFISSAQGCT